MSVSDRLGRLLFIVPYVVHRDGVPLSELAEVLKVSTQQIEADLDLLAMVGQPPLTPDHLIDLYVEDEIVYVALDQNLVRPLRLTHEEARALVLGAKLVGRLGGWGHELEVLLERIVQHLSPVDQEAVKALSARIIVKGEPADFDDHAITLRSAIEEHRVVEMVYYSMSSDRQKTYVLQPLALFTHGGTDYVVGLDTKADNQEKLYRLDRVASVQRTAAAFVPPASFDLEKFRTRRLYFGGENMQAVVRFAKKLDRQVRERFAAHEIVKDAPDDLQVRVASSSIPWLSRWVLSFGQDAEVLAPQSCRQSLRTLCEEAAAAYQTPVSRDGATAVHLSEEDPTPYTDLHAGASL